MIDRQARAASIAATDVTRIVSASALIDDSGGVAHHPENDDDRRQISATSRRGIDGHPLPTIYAIRREASRLKAPEGMGDRAAFRADAALLSLKEDDRHPARRNAPISNQAGK